jgi:cob(I)alamin adenosyltransferase
MKIYTRTGDKGSTGLFGGGRVPKHNDRIEAYGTVDETNAFIGIVRSQIGGRELLAVLDNQLDAIQNHLFTLGADLATPSESRARTARVAESHVSWLETCIDEFEADLPPLRHFVLPGGDPVAASLHGARTVCRRAERRVSRLFDLEDVSDETLVYLNRLSDYLFVASRWANMRAGVAEHIWRGLDRGDATTDG